MSELLQGGRVHIDRHLSNLALNYRPDGMIWDQICPIVPVMKKSDSFPNYSQADLFRREDAQRSPGTRAKAVKIGVSSDFYNVNNYALRWPMTLEDEANRDPEFRMLTEENRTRVLVDLLSIDAETRVASLALNTSNVGSVYTVVSAWTSATNATPINDIMTARANLFLGTGYVPNRMLFGWQAWNNFILNNQVRNSVMNPNVIGGGNFPMPEAVARFLGINRILIGAAIRNTADAGQSQTLSDMWSDQVLIYYAPDAPSIEQPSWMYGFRWAAAGIPNMTVERHPFDTREKMYDLEVGYYQHEKITSAAFCHWLRNVNSSH